MALTAAEWTIAALSAFSVLLVPTLLLIIRGTIKWTRTEDRLAELIGDMKDLVSDKDKVHREILEQMRQDRDATNQRLRFMEEFWMTEGRKFITGQGR